MTQRPLITGFNAYGRVHSNPSESLVTWVATRNEGSVIPLVLPTEYDAAVRALLASIESEQPSAVLMFGYTSRATGLRIERKARNRVASRGPDNSGLLLHGEIIAGGPAALATNVDVDQLVAMINRRTQIAYRSDSAGSYVCNFLYYRLLEWLDNRQSTIPCVFVHVSQAPQSNESLAKGVSHLVDIAVARAFPTHDQVRT